MTYTALIPPGSRVAEKPPLKAIHETRKLEYEEKWIPSSRPLYATQLDTTVPIVNPSPPSGTMTPIVNPTMSPPSPPSPTTTYPTLSPPANPTNTPANPTNTPPNPTNTPPITTNPGSSGGQWCIASPSASPTALQVALDYACGYGGADCSQLQPGASCYNPSSLKDHASFAFNDYYHKNPAPTSCVFGGIAQLTSTDPSSGSCKYPSSTGSTSTTPPANATPTPPTTATPTTPLNTPDIMTPDSTVYGSAEPTGLPSSASSISCSLLLFTSIGFGLLVIEKYI